MEKTPENQLKKEKNTNLNVIKQKIAKQKK